MRSGVGGQNVKCDCEDVTVSVEEDAATLLAAIARRRGAAAAAAVIS